MFEIKDMQGDMDNGLTTLPVAIGVSNTKLLAQGILFALMILVLVQYFFFEVPLSNVIAINLSLLISIFCIQPIREESSNSWFYFVIDGMMIFQFLLVYLAAKVF